MKKRPCADMKQDQLTQMRFRGSEVLGMEYTTSVPIDGWNAAPAKMPCIDGPWDHSPFRYKSTTRGKKA